MPDRGVIVIEDAHWADDATRDVLVFVARRIRDTHVVLVVTFRDDEVGPDHPLRRVLGQLATFGGVERITLAPLSSAGVSELVGPDADADYVHQVTGGNPFFVSALVASVAVAPDAVPATVADAVLARTSQLSGAARAVLETAAMSPESLSLGLLRAVSEARHGEHRRMPRRGPFGVGG